MPALDWKTLAVLITSGPTREYIDPVRYLTNASSGRMGRELAAAALRRGARVTVVSGPAEVPPPPGAEVVSVQTAEQMRRQTLRRAAAADVVIGAAAVSDWRAAAPARHKLKRDGSPMRLTLLPNRDIIKEAAAIVRGRGGRGRRPRVVAGFALETRGRLRAAREKLVRKGLDLVVANGPESLGSGRARFDLVTRERVVRLGTLAKKEAAERVLDAIGALLSGERDD